jgi:hypothetical protein
MAAQAPRDGQPSRGCPGGATPKPLRRASKKKASKENVPKEKSSKKKPSKEALIRYTLGSLHPDRETLIRHPERETLTQYTERRRRVLINRIRTDLDRRRSTTKAEQEKARQTRKPKSK